MTLLAALLIAFAQDQDRIQDLIRKLGSDDFSVRELATEELKKIGKPAQDALKKAAAESEDPEVRQRAKSILEEAPKAPAPRRALPGRPGFRGSSVSVRSVNGDTTYTITPGDGSAVLTFHKAAAGPVKLDYTDDKGDAKSAEAPTLEAFVKDQKELAQKFGISEEGIDYAGSRVSFKGVGVPNFNFPRALPQRPPRVPPPAAEEDQGTRVAGATLEAVDEATRAQLDIPEGQGAVVTRVAPGSAAETLGLKKHDVLLEIDGRKIASPEAAKGLITPESKATVLRRGKKETLGGRKDF